MSSPTEKLKDRLRGLKNPLQNLRRDSLGSSSPVPGASAASWRGVAKELTFSEAEMAQPAIIKDENRTTGKWKVVDKLYPGTRKTSDLKSGLYCTAGYSDLNEHAVLSFHCLRCLH